MVGRLLLFLSMVSTAAGAVAVPPQAAPAAASIVRPCSLSAPDQAWLNRAMAAWAYTSRNITRITRVKNITAVIFDAHCMVTSRTAIATAPEFSRGR